MATTFERGITGASTRASARGTRFPVVSYPLNIGSPASTTSSSSSSSRMPYEGLSAPALNRTIFTGASLRRGLVDQAGHPAVRVGSAAVLDVRQLLAQRHRQLARGRVRGSDREVGALQLRDRRDDRSRAAGEHLRDLAGLHAVAPLVESDRALLHRVAAVPGELQDAVAGDALEDAVGLRRDERA